MVSGFRWEVAGTLQFFMTFFLIFFNGHCYMRYVQLYQHCMISTDSILLFVHELTISFPQREFDGVRFAATKYLLAAIYLFYMGITGGALSNTEWNECVQKGLITKSEMALLQQYPGGRVTLVLTTWAMVIIDHGLQQDLCWKDRAQRIAHTHNRIYRHVASFVKSTHAIGNTLALPIPFPYYHIMNVILLTNFLLIAAGFSLFKTYMTIFPFSLALMIFMGLREVAGAMADPFGQDEVDFPIARFLDYTFEHTVCLLEVFSLNAMGVEEYIKEKVNATKDFTDIEMRREMDPHILYSRSFDPRVDNQFAWDRQTPIQTVDVNESPTDVLAGTLVGYRVQRKDLVPHDEDDPEVIKRANEAQIKLDEFRQRNDETDRDTNALREELAHIEAELKQFEELDDVEESEKADDAEEEAEDPVKDPGNGYAPVQRELQPQLGNGGMFLPPGMREPTENVRNFDQARMLFRQKMEKAKKGERKESFGRP